MATMLRKRSILAAKLETTIGTAISLGASDAVFIPVMDFEITPEAEHHEREAPGSFSRLPGVVGARSGKASFKIEMAGAGSDANPAWADTFLPACGLVVTDDSGAPRAFALLSQAPVAAAENCRTITIGKYTDGRLTTISGAMGNVKIIGENGKVAYLEFEFTGKYVSETDTALIVPTLPTLVPPRASNITLTIGGNTVQTAKFEIDLGNDIKLIEDMTTGGGTPGYAHAVIVDRNPMLKLQRNSVLVATDDIYGAWLAGTTKAIVIAIGGATWNKIEIAAPAARYTEIKPADNGGLAADDMTLQLTRTSANDNELTLTFTSGS